MIRFTTLLMLLILLSACKKQDKLLDEGYYRVYVNDNRLDYVDASTGEIIFSEFVNWDNPTKLQQAIINDKK